MIQDIIRLRGSVLLTCLLIANVLVIQFPDVGSSETKNVHYTYTLWIGSGVTQSFTISLVSPENTNFYTAMTQAAEINSSFAFEAKDTSFGHYVTTIARKKEDTKDNIYWLLYILPELPDKNHKPGEELMSPVGVDGLTVKDGGHYLFWYRNLKLYN